ncbi:MAG: cupin domain-containing protein [Bacteroidia bacterium]|nr:cupin domain-containing protein [Bacteroidia bacterium]
MKAAYLVKVLDMQPHPEGGFYRETYRSEGKISVRELGRDFGSDRSFSTAIYFLIEKDNFSAFHRIKSDETWHFYYGDTLEVLEIDDNGKLTITHIGNKIEEGDIFQYTVKANTWFGSRVKKGGNFSLVGCTVAPGFDFRDFEMGDRRELQREFPGLREIIEEMTR